LTEILQKVFSSPASFDRVDIFGLCVMIIAVILLSLSGRIAEKFPEESREKAKNITKLIALGVCIIGFIIAIV